jgi:2-hydroxychromene-2-carboxylate isomerase
MMNKTTWIGAGVCFVAGIAAMWGIDRADSQRATRDPAALASASAAAGSGVASGKVKVEMFVMAQCPYGVQAENGFKMAADKLADYVDLRLEFIGNTTPDGELSSMHGPAEVAGDVAQACAMKHVKKWFDFVLCQNKDVQSVATNWRECAATAGGDADTVEACMQSGEGRDLVAASFKLAESRGASGSPTIYINGKPYEGGRKPTDFVRAVCAAIPGEKPQVCADQAKPARVNVTILSDKRCAECDTAQLEDGVRKNLADPVLTKLDYGDPEGKKLFETIGPTLLPALVFDKTLEGDPDAAASFEGAPTKGEHKIIAVGEFNPVCADPDGCKTDACKSTMACRVEEPKKLEVFVMSQCPYGVKALDAMKEVLTHFKKQGESFDFQIHFIGDGNAAVGLSSMHGPEEVAEDLREICAFEHYKKDQKFMDYIWCRNPNVHEPTWQLCTGAQSGFDAKVIEKCAEGDEGKKLLEKSFAYSQASGVSGSPTWLVNGKYQFGGIDAETVRKNLCAHNKLKGCDATLTGDAGQ